MAGIQKRNSIGVMKALVFFLGVNAIARAETPSCEQPAPGVDQLVQDFTVLIKAIPPKNSAGPGEELISGAQFGKRKRRTVREAVYPFSSMGTVTRVGAKRGMNCTGTLVGPCQVLTAAHCLRYVEGTLHPTSFRPFGTEKDISVRDVIRGSFENGKRNREEDWAVLILDESVDTGIRWLEVDGAARKFDSANLMVAGFSGLNPDHRPTVDANVSVLGKEREGRVLLTNFSGAGGDSGSGLLVFDPASKVYRVSALTSYVWYGDFAEKDISHGTKMVAASNFIEAVEQAKKRGCRSLQFSSQASFPPPSTE